MLFQHFDHDTRCLMFVLYETSPIVGNDTEYIMRPSRSIAT
jgi:hypothetical protein